MADLFGTEFHAEPAICRACGVEFEPKLRQVLKRDFLCILCNRAYWREYWKKRKAAGRPKPSPIYRRSEARRRASRKYSVKLRTNPLYFERRRAREKLNYAVLKGRIKREPCSFCGNPKSQGHHPDYSKPFEVIWACKDCHAALHRKLRCVA